MTIGVSVYKEKINVGVGVKVIVGTRLGVGVCVGVVGETDVTVCV
jgi:hypothetical protein